MGRSLYSKLFRKITSIFITLLFSVSLVLGPTTPARAQYLTNLPQPGQMVNLSPAFEAPVLKGLRIDPVNPLHFNFMVDIGQDKLRGEALKRESDKLVKYYLAALTTPDKESWVNLSPYEGDRIIPDVLATTQMGKDMLEQDYLLKQLSASLTNPETETGKRFWDMVRARAMEKLHTTNIPMSTFNKVWIVPDQAEIFEDNGSVYIGKTHLKVMTDQDYLSVKENLNNPKLGQTKLSAEQVKGINAISAEVVAEVIIPVLEKEVNAGKNFTAVRQIYNSVVLAIWYKDALKESLLGKVYVDQQKVRGIDLTQRDIKQKVYQQYLEAFRKGVYNLIKEDVDSVSQETLPRKYFSGGVELQSKIREVLTRNALTREQVAAAHRIVGEYQSGKTNFADLQFHMTNAGVPAALVALFSAEIEGGRVIEVNTVLAETLREVSAVEPNRTTSSPAVAELQRQFEVLAETGTPMIKDLANEYLDSLNAMLADDAFIQATALKTDHTADEVRAEMSDTIYSEFARQLRAIADLLKNRRINPDRVHLRLSPGDDHTVTINSQDFIDENGKTRAPRVLYWPMKGDPWQAGHFWVMLETIAKYQVDKVVIGIDNSDPDRKPDLSSLAIREAVTKAMIEKYLKGFVEYTTLAKEDPKLFTADGETMVFSLMKLNKDVKDEKGQDAAIDWFYGAGSDHAFLYVPRKNEVKASDFISTGLGIDAGKAEAIRAALIDAHYLGLDGKIVKGALQPYGLTGNPRDLAEVNSVVVKLGLDIKAGPHIYQQLFAKDTVQKVVDNREAAGLANLNMTIVFSQRVGEAVDEQVLQSFTESFSRLKLVTITQIPDGSSSRVRKEGNWGLVPYWQMVLAAGLKVHRWGWLELSADQKASLDQIETNVTKLVAAGKTLTDDQLGQLKTQIQSLSGEGINLLDGFVVRKQLDYKMRDGRLNDDESAENGRWNQIREVVFAVANDKVQSILRHPLNEAASVYTSLTSSSSVDHHYTIKELTKNVMQVINARFETPLARQVLGNLIQDLVDQANNATVVTLYKKIRDYEHDREAAEEFINWLLYDVGPRLDSKIKAGTINPDKAAWVTFDERHKGVMPEVSEQSKVKVTVFATSGNPIQLAHIGQILNDIAGNAQDINSGTDFGLIVLQGTDKRKPDLLDMDVRAEILENSLLRNLYPFIHLSYLNEDGQGLDGEENLLRLSERNRDLSVDWHYLYGQDHNFRTTWMKKGLPALYKIYFQVDSLKAAMQASGLFIAPDGKVNEPVVDMVAKAMVNLAARPNAKEVFASKDSLLAALDAVEDHHMVQSAVRVFRQKDSKTGEDHFDQVFRTFDFSKFLNYFDGTEGMVNVRLLLERSRFEPGEEDYQEDGALENNLRFAEGEVDAIITAMADLKPYAFENLDTFQSALGLQPSLAKKFVNKKVLERIFFATAIWDTIMRFEEAVAGRVTIRGQEVSYKANEKHGFTIVAMPRAGELNPLFNGVDGVRLSDRVKGIESVPVPGFAGAAATGIRVNGNWLWTTHSIYLAICDYVSRNGELFGVDKLKAGKPNLELVKLRTRVINQLATGQTIFTALKPGAQNEILYESIGLVKEGTNWIVPQNVVASSPGPVGGIDFDPSLLKLQIKRNGQGVPLPLPQQNIEQIHIDGLYPVILNIRPMPIESLPFLSQAPLAEAVGELSKK